jgi:site-specific recombinase XerD
MASIFKRSKKKNEPYWIQYKDHLGKRKTAKGFTDKGLTEELAAKLETGARLRKTGLVDVAQEKQAATKLCPIKEHLVAFEESLSDNSDKYVRQTLQEVRRVIGGASFQSLADFEPEAVQRFLRTLRKTNKFGHRTYNHYLQSIDTFCNWCVATKRLSSNPLAGIERLNTAVDVRHQRRALTADEVSRMIESARSSGVRVQGYNGEQRARIYLLSYLTGLRKKELASLTLGSFDLLATPPTLTVDATVSKHRRKDVLPLHPELVTMIPKWVNGLQSGQKLFPLLARRKAARMVRKDLERVGILYKTKDGVADFHAAGRHTHITELFRNGASLPEAKELARHSDIKTTMRYTHIGIQDQARAVAAIPVPKKRSECDNGKAHEESAALQMRCNPGVSGRLSLSQPVNGEESNERLNPFGSTALGVNCHRLSHDGKVGATGFEPATSWSRTKRSSQAELRPERIPAHAAGFTPR